MLCVLCLIVLWGFSLVTSYSGVREPVGPVNIVAVGRNCLVLESYLSVSRYRSATVMCGPAVAVPCPQALIDLSGIVVSYFIKSVAAALGQIIAMLPLCR